MKKALKVTSALCVLIALAAIIFGIMAMRMTGRSWYVGYAMFRMFQSGTFMGTLGNIIIMVFTVASFGAAGIFGFIGKTKKAFIWSLVMAGISLVSLIVVIIGKKMVFGDIVMTVIPLAHLFLVYKSTE